MNLNEEIIRIFERAGKETTTRFAKQRAIEEAIAKLSPDFNEASELVAAILSSLRASNDDNLVADLEHDFKTLMELLDDMDDANG